MKKFITIAIIIIFLLGIIVFLNYNNKDEVNKAADNLKKAQIIEVYDSQTNEQIAKYEKQEDINNFVKKLNIDKWTPGIVTSKDLEKYLIKLYQELTKKTLQNNTSEMEEVGTILIYASGKYVDFTIKGMELNFETNVDLSNIFFK